MIQDLQQAGVPSDVIDRAVAANDRYYKDLYTKALKNGYTRKELETWFGNWKPK